MDLVAKVLIERQQERSRREGCLEPDCPNGARCAKVLESARDARMHANDVVAHNGYVNCQGCYFRAWVPTTKDQCAECKGR